MSSRREFVALGALAMGAIAARREVVAAAITTAQSQAYRTAADPLYAAIYDDRFPESAAFAARTRSRGERTQSLDRGDVTRVWYDDLCHRWKQGPAAIAGLAVAAQPSEKEKIEHVLTCVRSQLEPQSIVLN